MIPSASSTAGILLSYTKAIRGVPAECTALKRIDRRAASA
jgi:hypothetical protein